MYNWFKNLIDAYDKMFVIEKDEDFMVLDVNKDNISSSSLTYLFLGILIASIISISGPTTTPNNYFFIFLTGSIAICAMILPGISGSFILLLLSKYEFIINSIKDFKFDVLIVFALGCIFGLLLFSRFLSYLFLNYNCNCIA